MDRISTENIPAVFTTNDFIRLKDIPCFFLFPDKPLLLSTKWLNLIPAKLDTEFVKVFEVVSDGIQQAWAFKPLTKRVKHGPGYLLFHSAALDNRDTLLKLAKSSGLHLRYALPDWHYLSDPSNLVMITLPPKPSLIETLES
jgi:hypothetical protein